MDILQATLAANIRVVKYVPSYGDQPNEITHVVKCTSLHSLHFPWLSCPPSCGQCERVIIDCVRSCVQTSGTNSGGITYVSSDLQGSQRVCAHV